MAASWNEPETGDKGILFSLSRILNILISPPFLDKTTNRVKATAVVESGTVTTVTTVTTVGNISTVGGLTAQALITNTNLSAWNDCVRSKIV